MSFCCMLPGIYSHISGRFSAHASGQENLPGFFLLPLFSSSFLLYPYKTHRLYDTRAQTGRLSEVAYYYHLYDSCFSMAQDFTAPGTVESTRRKDGSCHRRDARGLRADGWRVRGRHKTMFVSISGNKQPSHWQTFCKLDGKWVSGPWSSHCIAMENSVPFIEPQQSCRVSLLDGCWGRSAKVECFTLNV